MMLLIDVVIASVLLYISITQYNYALLVLSIISFALFGFDKYLAKSKSKRIPNKVLMSMVVVGVVGSIFAMIIFNHKTKKWYYLLCVQIALILHYILIWRSR